MITALRPDVNMHPVAVSEAGISRRCTYCVYTNRVNNARCNTYWSARLPAEWKRLVANGILQRATPGDAHRTLDHRIGRVRTSRHLGCGGCGSPLRSCRVVCSRSGVSTTRSSDSASREGQKRRPCRVGIASPQQPVAEKDRRRSAVHGGASWEMHRAQRVADVGGNFRSHVVSNVVKTAIQTRYRKTSTTLLTSAKRGLHVNEL